MQGPKEDPGGNRGPELMGAGRVRGILWVLQRRRRGGGDWCPGGLDPEEARGGREGGGKSVNPGAASGRRPAPGPTETPGTAHRCRFPESGRCFAHSPVFVLTGAPAGRAVTTPFLQPGKQAPQAK